ncbi:5-(carboxyamino)imidazole ribonucleotide synthase [Haloglomus irregulare]|uniref:N5-carboxyaminoimidazole ribonucleotide synthase n=1 Tax=Haloglomus irregulare TaxID=2234134 RepID=A0A554N7C9_9EURY|nr:5-(carboxyamino)imidazole ribonucleotide synthase [Haloglomus irregulare]TSD13305.1 5-(carboxyamino)imidazole ribonucleotide synthase [Haloglomus irregulare]
MQDSDGFDGTLAAPGPTLGVVGGGQLGRMLGEAAGPLGVELVVSDPTPDCPARSVVRDQVVGDFDDYGTLRELGERADVLTFEIELADPDTLDRVSEETGTPVHPAPETLRTIQDKLVQKEALAGRGIPVPAYRRVDTADDLLAAGDELGWPLMLKARQGGYDGRGNLPVAGPDEAEAALDAVAGPAMAEELLDFERELAVMGLRGAGERDSFPVTETIHREEILRESVSPARASEGVRARAREVADEVLDAMDGRGAFGIELFQVDPDHHGGEAILVNEIAPRPHNSGHWTIEGCLTSQFENHVRAVLGWPLGATDRRAPTVTANLLGDVDETRPAELRGVDAVLEADGAALHWYCKREARPLRKLGHVTLPGDPGDRVDDLLTRVRELRDATTFRPGGSAE